VGAALVAFCLLADLGAQASVASDISDVSAPETTGQPGFVPGILALQASGTSESRAGVAPILPGFNPQSFVAELLIPRLALELRNPGLVFAAWYSPRFFWEYPNPSSLTGLAPNSSAVSDQTPAPNAASEPLILHTFGLTLDARTSRSVRVTAAAGGSIGQPDYTTLPQVLGTVQPTLPSVVELAAANAQAGVVATLSQRWQVSLAGQVSHWQWLDIPPDVSASGAVTSQTSASLEPAGAFRLTVRDLLGLGAAVGWVSYSTGNEVLTVTPAVTWKRHLDRDTDLNLRLGLTYARLLDSGTLGTMPVLGGGETQAVSPIGSAELIVHLARLDQIMFLGRAFAGVDFYFDPIVGTGQPRGLAAAELTAVSVPSWTVSLRGDFATVLEDVPTLPGQIPPDETAFSVTLAVRRRVTENFYAELGGRWANRGPTLDTPDFRFDQLQLWAYLSLIGTTRPIPRPALPRE
jgi:hypothetical protein